VKLELADGSPYPSTGRLNFSGSTVDPALGTVQMKAPRRPLKSFDGLQNVLFAFFPEAFHVAQLAVFGNFLDFFHRARFKLLP